jgi:hypothetical protein
MQVEESATETNDATRHVFRNGRLLNVGDDSDGAETPTREETDDDAVVDDNSPVGGVSAAVPRAISPASHRRPKGKASAPSSAERRKKKRAADLAILKRNGYESWIGAAARQAVFDSMPFAGEGRAPSQFLYWANTPRNACALRLIKRTPRLQEHAVQFGGPEQLSESIAAEVSLHARKARNKHIYELRKLFFSKKSVFQFASGVTENDCFDKNGKATKMTIVPRFQSNFPSIASLRECLMSPNMHANELFYSNFVNALASGKLSKIRKQGVSTKLVNFVALNYEAHFRLELWYALSKQGIFFFVLVLFMILLLLTIVLFVYLAGFRHECTDDTQQARSANMEKMRMLVKQDRFLHNVDAEMNRMDTSEVVRQQRAENERLALGSGALESDVESAVIL